MIDNVLKIFKIIGIIIIICIAIIPFVLLLKLYNKQKKSIRFSPKFEVVEITNSEVLDKEVLQSGLDKIKEKFNL